MPVLETIMAANAAYGVIRKCLENGREVQDMVSHVGKFLSAESDLKDAVERKRKTQLQLSQAGKRVTGKSFKPLRTLKKSAVNWSLGAGCMVRRALGTAG